MKASQMSVSDNGVNLVKHFEGLYLKTYLDEVGVPTIGYGHTKGVQLGQTLRDEQEAHNILKQDLESHMIIPKQDITIDLNQNQYDALCSFAFNLGGYIFRNNQNLLDAINSGNWNEASRIMNLFVNAGGKPYNGLIRRRKAETDLMLTPCDDVSRGTNSYDSSWFTKQRGIFTANTTIKVRNIPSVNGEHIRTLYDGGQYMYDGYGYEQQGYVWLRGVDGTYLASGETVNGIRQNYWGTFK